MRSKIKTLVYDYAPRREPYPYKISKFRWVSKNRTRTLNLVTKFRNLPQEKAILKEKTWKNKRKKENKLICW